MAGNKKNHRKRRKKSWRTILEGYIHRSLFVNSSNSGKHQVSSGKHQVSSQQQPHHGEVSSQQQPHHGEANKLRRFQTKAGTSCCHVSTTGTDVQGTEQPLKGILKKSPTVSSGSSQSYSEVAVDVPDSWLNSRMESSQTRPALLVNSPTKTADRKHDACDGQSAGHCAGRSDEVLSGPNDKCLVGALNRRSQSFNGFDSVGDRDHRRENETDSKFHPCNDTYNQSYEALKNRLQKRYLVHKLRTVETYGFAGACSTSELVHCVGQNPDHQMSTVMCELQEVTGSPQSTLACRHNPTLLSAVRSSSPDDTYVELTAIQQRKHLQRYLKQQSVEASGKIWPFQGSTSSYYSSVSDSRDVSVPTAPQTACSATHGRSLRPNGYTLSSLSRSRNPVNASLNCPCSDLLNCNDLVNETGEYIQEGESCFDCLNNYFSVATNDSSDTSFPDAGSLTDSMHSYEDDTDCPSIVNNHTVKVSQVYATVARSNTKSSSSSYIYASVSWRAPRGSQREDTEDSIACVSPDNTQAPPIPPRQLGNTGLISSIARELSDIEYRPPLPSYEEILESRLKCEQQRVATDAEFPLNQETEKKREAFMQLLAQRYPQYAEKIQGTEASPMPQGVPQDKPSRARDSQRRRTAVVTYNSSQAANVLEYDDVGTMSDLELPSFQRGGLIRTSMPIVRSASTSLERPLGLVFLVYGDQTKKSMLPNEITTLDTVRALFVRAFPDLTLEMLEDPRKKIYLLDPATNIYFQLEDLMDIKDRSVLKIHETDNEQPQKVKERQEVRGRTVQMPVARSHAQQVYAELPLGHEVYAKSQSLPTQATQNYPEMMQEQHNMWEFERRSRSRTPEASDRPRSLSAGAASRQRFSHSPDRQPTPERVPLNPIPENRQVLPGYIGEGNYYETVGPGPYRGQYSSGIYESPATYQGYPPSSPGPAQQTYIARSTRAPAIAHPQRAVVPGSDIRDSSRGSNANRHSLAFAPVTPGAAMDAGSQLPQNYHIPPAERGGAELSRSTTPAEDMTRNRIEKMEQQLASLTAWVHYQKDGTRRESVPRSLGSTTSDGSDTLPASSASKHKGETPSVSNTAPSSDHVASSQGLSDIHNGFGNQRSSRLNSRESTPLSAQKEISAKLAQLKNDLHILRRQQQLNMEAMRDEFLAASIKIKKVMASVPGAQNQMNFYKRNEATNARRNYTTDKERVEKELSDLEASVEELRTDVISRQCRVNTSDVEGMALLLSNITKALADLKAQFPEVQGLMKGVMDAELRVVVSEEKFLKEEPTEIEHCLKRCKKITGTLYTLKRLASVQDHRPPHVPNMAPTAGASLCDQKKVLLDNIRSLVPDHEQRVKEMEAADASRERKKKISSQQEALKFGKSLEIASKNLRPPSLTDVRVEDADEDMEIVKAYHGERGGQSNQVKSVAPTKPAVSSSSPTTHLPSAATISLASTSAKNSFPSSTVLKQSDKPTATVSAMTAGVSDTITMMAKKTVEKESGATIPLTQTTDCLNSAFLGRTETLSHSIKVGTESPKKKDATVYTYQISGTVNPVFPVSTPAIRPENIDGLSSKTSQFSDKLTGVHTDAVNRNANMHSDLHNSKRKVSITDQPFAANGDSISPPSTFSDQPDSLEKTHQTTQRQTARSTFFSSLNTPPDSPSSASPNRNSVGVEIGSNVSPGGQSEKAIQGSTAHKTLSGTATPKSPTSSGSYSSSLPSDMTATGSKTVSSLQNSPTRGIPRPAADSKPLSVNAHLPTGSESTNKHKKVPPPPPPRKDSRPTSANISPVNGGPLDFSQQSHDMPHFVGGILGQHRLSGGPLFSTPKPIPQQKPASKFEQDIASGIYANMNRPDVQSQKHTPQQMIHAANIPNNANSTKDSSQSYSSEENMAIPPPPSVTIALDREERGSSSESSSSSGTSMGSQQSVVSVIRSPSSCDKTLNKAKPDPPKRQSSLLAKFTGGKESKSKINNGKAKVSGVDL